MPDYPPNMKLRPLERWPVPTTETKVRPRSPFSAGWSDTMGILMTELRQLGTNPRGPAWSAATYPPSVLQVAIREKDFRNDGMPRANAVPVHPGVVLNIESKHGSLSYPCDAFDRWQDNLRAIAKGLEALRKVDRYGISPGHEQYTGWKQLGSTSTALTVAEARDLLIKLADADDDPLRIDTAAQAYRRARIAAHPDRHGGDHTLAYQVEAAAEVLRAAGEL